MNWKIKILLFICALFLFKPAYCQVFKYKTYEVTFRDVTGDKTTTKKINCLVVLNFDENRLTIYTGSPIHIDLTKYLKDTEVKEGQLHYTIEGVDDKGTEVKVEFALTKDSMDNVSGALSVAYPKFNFWYGYKFKGID